MLHLSPERVAALVDDTPTPSEAAHITTCTVCTAELDAQRRLSRMAAAAQPHSCEPLSDFDGLLPRLRAEGLVASPERRSVIRRWGVRAAAALVLFAAGTLAGRLTAGTELPVLAIGGPPSGGAAALSGVAESAAGFKTADEAMRTLAVAQQAYQSAAAFLAAQDTSSHFIGLNQSAYRTRLAALDEITSATRAALYRAPQDPMLNQYYLATLSAREATLRQIGQTMPVTRKLESY